MACVRDPERAVTQENCSRFERIGHRLHDPVLDGVAENCRCTGPVPVFNRCPRHYPETFLSRRGKSWLLSSGPIMANFNGVRDLLSRSRLRNVLWAARKSTSAMLPDSRRRTLLPSTAQISPLSAGLQEWKSSRDFADGPEILHKVFRNCRPDLADGGIHSTVIFRVGCIVVLHP